MDQDTKVTFAVIGVLIVFLAGLAYFLRESIGMPLAEITGTATTTKSRPPLKVTNNTYGTSTTGTANGQLQGTSTNATTTMDTTEKITGAIITTNKGTIEVAFASTAPETVKNFAKLAQAGFYNGTRFHRVIKDFMIQGGDPLSKDPAQKGVWGTGGPGYKFADELSGNEKYPQGTLAMANSGPNTNGSQFFIVTADPGYPLPPNYTVFGHVTKGIETALAIQNVKTDANDRPVEDVIVEKVVVVK
jgi:cyclophilin family peptidyl-prolyl cis-trans isomerase